MSTLVSLRCRKLLPLTQIKQAGRSGRLSRSSGDLLNQCVCSRLEKEEVYSRNLRSSTSVGDPKEDVHTGVSTIMLVGCSSTAAQGGQTHLNVTLKLHYSSFQIPVLISKFSCNNRPGLETFVSVPASLAVPSNRNMLDSSAPHGLIKHHPRRCFTKQPQEFCYVDARYHGEPERPPFKEQAEFF